MGVRGSEVRGLAGSAECAEVLFGEGGDGFVVEVAGCGDGQIGGGIVALVEVVELGFGEGLDGAAIADDGAAEGVAFPEVGDEEFVDEGLGGVEFHLEFFEDDALFLFDVLGVEAGVEEHVGKDVESGGEVLVEDFGGVADEFAAGEGVELAAEGVDFTGDVFGAAAGGAFEEHVFDEVADAVFGRFFGAGAATDPDAGGDGADGGHGLGDDADAVGQSGDRDVARGGGLLHGLAFSVASPLIRLG